MNKTKKQGLLKYIGGIYFLGSALFLWSCGLKETPPQIVDLKEIVAMNAIPSQSDLSSYSQDLQDVLGPLAGDTAKTLGAVYVSENGTGAQDGSSWNNAYAGAELKTAIDKAGKAASTTKPYLVLIASGTYSISETLNMKNNVAIIGGINNNWSPDKTERSILDGAGSTQIFSNLGIDSRAILYGVSITNGSTFESGGGMLNHNASPTLSQIIFSENIADDSGGGMYNVYSSPILNQITFSDNLSIDGNGGGMADYESSPTLSQVTFSNNLTTKHGGGIYNKSSSPTLVQVTFSENTAERGGGMHNDDSSPILEAVTFFENTAEEDGGGMANYESSPTLSQVTFSENTAERGGGIHNSDSSPILEAVTFSGNTASHGGGMYSGNSSPTLVRVTFSNNRTNNDGTGGGMYNGISSPTLKQVTFSNNKARFGGGMHNFRSSPTLVQVTFSGNTASYSGGGMYNHQKPSPILEAVTFSGNTAFYSGGGMHNNESSPTLKQVTFSENAAYQGGGMYNNNKSSPILEAVTFSRNTAENSGGGMHNFHSSPILNQVIFSGNTAEGDGGGMRNYESSPILEAVTFSENTVSYGFGGGMDNEGSSPILSQVTFSDNSATKNGGGMSNNNDGEIGPSISNSIFWGNTPNQIYMSNDSNDSDDSSEGDENLQIYYSILEGGSAGITSFDSSGGDKVTINSYGLIVTTNLNLASKLADNGGFVQTLALESGSPAIDAGIYVQKSDDNYYYSADASTWYSTLDKKGLRNNASPPDKAVDLTATDARGYAIVGRPDLGAYEFGGLSQANAPLIYTVAATSGLFVRNEPNLKAEKIGSLPHKLRVTVYKESKNTETIDGITAPWLRIKAVAYGQDIEGWAWGGYLKESR